MKGHIVFSKTGIVTMYHKVLTLQISFLVNNYKKNVKSWKWTLMILLIRNKKACLSPTDRFYRQEICLELWR